MGQDIDKLKTTLRPLMAGIVGAFGKHCEVVLHDLTRPERSIVWIEGNVTGRRVGGTLTDLGLAKLRLSDTQEDLLGYVTQTRDGKVLRSSSVFLRDAKGIVIGALCINVDITAFLGIRQYVQDVSTPVTGDIAETFSDKPADILRQLVQEGLKAVNIPPKLMRKRDRIELVAFLDGRGAFLLRSAVPMVSRVLGTSRYTLYNYLKEVRARARPATKRPETSKGPGQGEAR